MSVEDLMQQRVTLQMPVPNDDLERDAIGGVEAAYTEMETTMYLEPSAGFDIRLNRDTGIGDWRGFGRVSVDFTAWQRVVYDGHVLDIVSPPRKEVNPRTLVPSHWELDLQEVQ